MSHVAAEDSEFSNRDLTPEHSRVFTDVALSCDLLWQKGRDIQQLASLNRAAQQIDLVSFRGRVDCLVALSLTECNIVLKLPGKM